MHRMHSEPRGRAVALAVFLVAMGTSSVASALPAFPGAEGPGAAATGGRGGRVIEVTNLNASGPGSLQAALDATGPRIVVFTVSGVIRGNQFVRHGDLTVAGQTAPGGGVTIEGTLYNDTTEDNMILRHLRVRPPPKPANIDGNQYDALRLYQQSRVIVDHCSISWGVDETVDFYEANDATIQWSEIAEAAIGGHPDGPNHDYGFIQGPDGRRLAVHHNLFASNLNRNPAVANGPADIRNNVVYNVRHGFIHHNPASGPFAIVGNYYRQGPDNTLIPFYFDDENGFTAPDLRYWLADNFIDDPGDGCTRVVDDPWTDRCHPSFAGMLAPVSRRAAAPFDFAATAPGWVAVTTQSPVAAYELVLARAGAFPRDAVSTRIVSEVKSRTGGLGLQPGDRPADLMTGLTPGPAPADTDADGMPDAWETAHGLNAQQDDSRVVRPSGYTAVEEYINGLADALTGTPGATPEPADAGTAAPPTSADAAVGPAAGGVESRGDAGNGKGTPRAGACAMRRGDATGVVRGGAVVVALAGLLAVVRRVVRDRARRPS